MLLFARQYWPKRVPAMRVHAGYRYNGYLQLGDGTDNSTNRPEQIVSGSVMAVAPGGEFSLFIRSDGSLWGMGYNEHGQLGGGTNGYYSYNYPERIAGPPLPIAALNWSPTSAL